jgi:hypothetical protein
MAHTGTYRVSVETLENGYSVEVPDMAAIAKKHADEKKMRGNGSMPSMYMGDRTKKFAAKSVKEVLKLVQNSLEQLPEGEYDTAFSEAASKK